MSSNGIKVPVSLETAFWTVAGTRGPDTDFKLPDMAIEQKNKM